MHLPSQVTPSKHAQMAESLTLECFDERSIRSRAEGLNTGLIGAERLPHLRRRFPLARRETGELISH